MIEYWTTFIGVASLRPLRSVSSVEVVESSTRHRSSVRSGFPFPKSIVIDHWSRRQSGLIGSAYDGSAIFCCREHQQRVVRQLFMRVTVEVSGDRWQILCTHIILHTEFRWSEWPFGRPVYDLRFCSLYSRTCRGGVVGCRGRYWYPTPFWIWVNRRFG